MKKNKLFLLGLFVVFAAVLSLSLVSNTLAKYTTSDGASDSARVAKWGVSVDVASAAFQKSYAKDDVDTAITNTVVAEEKVLAPGTKGTLVTVDVAGQPEVAVEVEFDFTLTLTKWSIESVDYCPLVFTVKLGTAEAQEFKFEGDVDTVDELIKKITEYVESVNEEYEANSDLNNNYDLTISWAWAFEGDNVKDTALGNQAEAGNAAGIGCALTVTVTQIN